MIILLFHLFFDRKWSLVSCKRSIKYYVRYTLWWLKIIEYKSSRIRFKDLWEIYESNTYDILFFTCPILNSIYYYILTKLKKIRNIKSNQYQILKMMSLYICNYICIAYRDLEIKIFSW